MKRILTTVLAAAFILGGASAASAVDVKASGIWDFAFGWADNTSFDDHSQDDNFIARQRIRLQADFIASENLRGVLMFEIGDSPWGFGGAGADLDADDTVVEVRRAYLDWVIPSTDVSVRMGVQGLGLPMATAYRHPVFDNDVAAVVVNAPLNDLVGLTAFWARPFDSGNVNTWEINGREEKLSDETDMFGLMIPVTGEGWGVTPWGVYGRLGAGSGFLDYVNGTEEDWPQYGGGDAANLWWGGVAFELSMFDPLNFAVDAMYGSIGSLDYYGKATGPAGERSFETRGWFLDAALDYNLDWATAGLFGWYSTGDDADDVKDGEYGRMLAVSDEGYGVTSMGAPGCYNIGTDTLISLTMVGTWGVGVKLADVSFIEDLSHTLRLAYYRGTNDADVIRNEKNGGSSSLPGLTMAEAYMTDEDHAVEINFEHIYQLYDNMTMAVEFGYIIMEADSDVWKGYEGDSSNLYESDNAWKAQVSFQYAF